jgi:hypothetical protein
MILVPAVPEKSTSAVTANNHCPLAKASRDFSSRTLLVKAHSQAASLQERAEKSDWRELSE